MSYKDKEVQMTMGEFESAMKANRVIGMVIGVFACCASMGIIGAAWWIWTLI